jgi:hypothetical protein
MLEVDNRNKFSSIEFIDKEDENEISPPANEKCMYF